MPRPKKKAEAVLKQDTFSEDLPVAEPEETPTVREKHTVVTQWVQQKPLGAESVIETPDDDDDDDAFELAPDDPIAEVIEEMAESSLDWSLAVYRLPGFEENGKAGAGHRKFSGAIPIPSPEWLRNQFHLEEIQRKFAREGMSNYFALEARKGNRIKKTLGVVAVEPLPPSSLPGVPGLNVDPNASTINVYGNQQNPAEAIEAHFALMNKYLGFAQKLNSTFQQPQQPVFQQQPINKKALLFEALVEDDPMLGDVKLLARKFLGEATNDGPNIWSFLSNVINSPMAAGIAQRVLAAQPANGHAQPEAPPQIPLDVQAQQRLLAALTNAMRLNINPEEALPAIDGFLALFPEQRPTIEQLLSAEPAQLLSALPQFFPPAAEVVGLPHAVEWVGKLKAVYFGEGEETEALK